MILKIFKKYNCAKELPVHWRWMIRVFMQKIQKKIDWEIIEATKKKIMIQKWSTEVEFNNKKNQLLTKKNWLNFFYSLLYFNIYKISITTIKSNLICVYNLNHKMRIWFHKIIKLQHSIRCEFGRTVVSTSAKLDCWTFVGAALLHSTSILSPKREARTHLDSNLALYIVYSAHLWVRATASSYYIASNN